MKIFKGIIAISLLVSSVMAIEPMQKEAGWSGFVLLGAGGINFKNNEIAGNPLVDVEEKQIHNYGEATSQSTGLPVITGVARYTLEDKKTEFFLGNSLEDYLRMDNSLALGVRHVFNGVGILGVRLLFSTTPTQVWEDPFVKDTDRKDTDRTSAGLGLKWEKIFGSNFEVDVRARKMEFSNDINGQALNSQSGGGTGTVDADAGEGAHFIDDAGQKLLEREGLMTSAELLYTWHVAKSNLIIPSIKFISSDRDGDARDYSETSVKLGHLFFNQKWLIASNVFIGEARFDKENPVFQKKQDTTIVGAGVNVTYQKPFGWEDWNLNAGLVATQANSEIDFYDTSFVIATFGFAYVF